MSPPLESVRDQLLRAGIAPRHVRRYVIELQEHLADLTARERGTGLDAKAAAHRARALLGTDAHLVQSIIDKTPRSVSVRIPWAVFSVLPVALLVAVLATIAGSMMHLLAPVHAAWPGGVPNTYNGIISGASFVADYVLGPVIAAGCIALALRQRLSSRWVWVGIGLIALISGMFGFYMNILPPRSGFPGGAVFSAVPAVIVNGRISTLATLALVALRAGVLFAFAAMALRVLRTRLDSNLT